MGGIGEDLATMGGVCAKGSHLRRTVQLPWEGSHMLHLGWKPDVAIRLPQLACPTQGRDLCEGLGP
jgi:hypothetical protein